MPDEFQPNTNTNTDKKLLVLLFVVGIFLFLGLVSLFVYKAVNESSFITEEPVLNERKLDEALVKERLVISQKSTIAIPKADSLTEIKKEDLPSNLVIFVPTDSVNEARYLKLDFKGGAGYSFLYNKNGELAQIFSDFFSSFQDSNVLYSSYGEKFGMIEIEGTKYQIQINLAQLETDLVEVSIQVLPKSI
ncbi:MAG: hypothetical protein GX627_03100 [Parcubacteria group bacterium]|jgi:hypothetical protein|nr:hypothetical protein [Parcubacteria group bacterium]